MRQILQNLRTGLTEVADVPCPAVSDGEVLIRSARTLISAGTERTLVSFGHASLLGKARAQPERVAQVVQKVKTDGLLPTIAAVRTKLDEELPLGYCNVGVVLETGAGTTDLRVGERVVSNGRHAEVVSVPRILCAPVPAGVPDDAAAFT